jgi:hypothetical protein
MDNDREDEEMRDGKAKKYWSIYRELFSSIINWLPPLP